MSKTKEFTLRELASLTEAKVQGNPEYKITGYADLESADCHDISFLSNPRYTNTRYVNAMRQSQAGAIFIAPTIELSEGKNFLIHEDPSLAFQRAIEAIRGAPNQLSYFRDIHPTAVIHETAIIGEDVTIGPNVVIDGDVVIGKGSRIGAGTYIGPHSTMGDDCVIHANVTIREQCHLGNRVVIQPGAIIGSCGFGYSTDEKGHHTRITQVGKVTIEDDVEVGANCTIDRARFTSTRVGEGTKLDSSVVIGHNVKIGKHNLICGQSAVAGSTVTGNHVILAGQVGVDGHLKLDDGVMVTAKSGVTKSLKAGKYGGYPAQPLDQFNRNNVLFRNLAKYLKKN